MVDSHIVSDFRQVTWFSEERRPPRNRRSRAGGALRLEELESRRLLSISVGGDGPVLEPPHFIQRIQAEVDQYQYQTDGFATVAAGAAAPNGATGSDYGPVGGWTTEPLFVAPAMMEVQPPAPGPDVHPLLAIAASAQDASESTPPITLSTKYDFVTIDVTPGQGTFVYGMPDPRLSSAQPQGSPNAAPLSPSLLSEMDMIINKAGGVPGPAPMYTTQEPTDTSTTTVTIDISSTGGDPGTGSAYLADLRAGGLDLARFLTNARSMSVNVNLAGTNLGGTPLSLDLTPISTALSSSAESSAMSFQVWMTRTEGIYQSFQTFANAPLVAAISGSTSTAAELLSNAQGESAAVLTESELESVTTNAPLPPGVVATGPMPQASAPASGGVLTEQDIEPSGPSGESQIAWAGASPTASGVTSRTGLESANAAGEEGGEPESPSELVVVAGPGGTSLYGSALGGDWGGVKPRTSKPREIVNPASETIAATASDDWVERTDADARAPVALAESAPANAGAIRWGGKAVLVAGVFWFLDPAALFHWFIDRRAHRPEGSNPGATRKPARRAAKRD